jgi:hypothetical protein
VTLNLPGEAFDEARFPSLRLQVLSNDHPRGFGANHNRAFEHCRTPWFAILNPDLRLPTDPLGPLIEAARRRPEVALLGPRVLGPDGNEEDSVRAQPTPLSLLARRLGHRRSLRVTGPAVLGEPFYWLAGMFLLVRSDRFAQVKGFDERYFLYCEDYDLCARLYLAGHGVAMEPRASVIHAAQRDSHHSAKHMRWHVASLLRVWRSHAFWRLTLLQMTKGNTR